MIILEESDLNEEALTSIHETLGSMMRGASLGSAAAQSAANNLPSKKNWKKAVRETDAIKKQLSKNPNNNVLKSRLKAAKSNQHKLFVIHRKEADKLEQEYMRDYARINTRNQLF